LLYFFYFLEIDVVTVVEPMQNKDSTVQESASWGNDDEKRTNAG
jgi:hypothetical protein